MANAEGMAKAEPEPDTMANAKAEPERMAAAEPEKKSEKRKSSSSSSSRSTKRSRRDRRRKARRRSSSSSSSSQRSKKRRRRSRSRSNSRSRSKASNRGRSRSRSCRRPGRGSSANAAEKADGSNKPALAGECKAEAPKEAAGATQSAPKEAAGATQSAPAAMTPDKPGAYLFESRIQKHKTTRSRHKEVAALRFKYEKARQRIPPYQMAHHPKNRDGFCPNAQRCEELLVEIVGEFDCDEADHDAVCVELPRGDDQASIERRKVVIDHNIARASGIASLATVQPLELQYAKIGSSHLDQVLSNIASGARVQRSDLEQFVDSEGRLSINLIKARDADLGRYSSIGLDWQILRHDMEIEHPGAVELIMSVLNSKTDAQVSEHEFQALARLARIVSSCEIALASRVAEETVREKLADAGMSELAYSDDFRGILAFVVNAGAANSIHMRRLFAFHNYCISARSRRIRFSTIAALSGVPEDAPRTRNLLTKYAYSGPVSNGFCSTMNSQKVTIILQNKRREFLTKFERQLKLFHDHYEEAYKGMEEAEHARLMTKIDLHLAPALFERDLDDAQNLLSARVAECNAILRAKLKGEQLAFFNKLCPPQAFGKASSSKQVDKPKILQPRVISFNSSGDALDKQDMETEAAEKWADVNCELLHGLDVTEAKSQIILALALAGESIPQPTNTDFKAQKHEGSKGFSKVKVEAKRNFAAREVAILPRVRGPECITTKAVSERAVATNIADKEGNTFNLVPFASDAVGSEFQPLFSILPYSPIPSRTNLVVDYLHVDISSKARLRASGDGVPALKVKADNVIRSIAIPYITNPEAIQSGALLCLHVEPQKKEKKERKKRNWLDIKPKDEQEKNLERALALAGI